MQSRRTAARAGTRHPAPLQIALAIASVALVALLAACSSPAASANGVVSLASAAPGSSAAPSASALTPEEAALAYAQCMRDHGVDMPDPVFHTNGDGGGTIQQTGPDINPEAPAYKTANDACKHFQEDIKRGATNKPMTAAEQQAFLDYAACMRDHGVDMADPTFEGGGVSIMIGKPGKDGGPNDGGGVDPQSAAYQAAESACHHFLEAVGRGGFGGGANGPAAGSGPQNSTASAEPSQPAN